MVHYGKADELWERRRQVLLAAAQLHPERFVESPPLPLLFPRLSGSTSPRGNQDDSRGATLNSKRGCLNSLDTFRS